MVKETQKINEKSLNLVRTEEENQKKPINIFTLLTLWDMLKKSMILTPSLEKYTKLW